MGKNKTLFDFFTSPKNNTPKATPLTPKSNVSTTPKTKLSNGSGKKRPLPAAKSSPDSDDLNTSANENKAKRRRLVVASDSDDSEDEYKPGKMDVESDDDDLEELWDDFPSDVEFEPDDDKPKKNSKAKPSKSKISPKVASKKPKVDSPKVSPTVSQTEEEPSARKLDEQVFDHSALDFLWDDKIRDKQGRPKSHPDYDPSTLFVSETFKKSRTPGHRQWWEMKANHFDTVLFFKVGKFYELYHMDAVVGFRELNLNIMKGDYAHCGFPEIAYGRYSSLLVDRGYKVARIEQTETPEMMEKRIQRSSSKATKFDKVVAREICQITTRGTRVFNYQDGKLMGADNRYLICVTEKLLHESSASEREYGVCFIDTSVGKFYVGQFLDDCHCSRLRTLFSHYVPIEIIYDKSALSKKTEHYFTVSLGNIKQSSLGSSGHFWDASKTLKLINNKRYFLNNDEGTLEWPSAIKDMLDENDLMFETPKREFELAMKAFCGCFWYLKTCLVEEQLLTMKLFEKYVPLDTIPVTETRTFGRRHMILDGVALQNLEILSNYADAKDTLMHTLNFCVTNFGKRLLHQWLCAPLCNPQPINDRYDAVEDLEKICHVVDESLLLLKDLPDLERLLSRIHAQAILRSIDHPDSRAIFYEEVTYNKRKILDFLSTLKGFKVLTEVFHKLEPFAHSFKSQMLSQATTLSSKGGAFPELGDMLEYFDNAFDHEKAKKVGCILPNKNVDEEYDASIAQIHDTETELEDYLNKQKKKFQCKITYFGTGRNRYQLEIPESAAKSADNSYDVQSQRKGFKRFHTKFIKERLATLTAAEERRDAAKLDIMRRIFLKFDKHYELWSSAIQCISVFDVLVSLMKFKKSSHGIMCRPEIVVPAENEQPFLKIIDGRHPCKFTSFFSDSYIPNSIYLGPKMDTPEKNLNVGGNIVLVTGPNMGGKSTLMRQTGLITILAQLGSYVPAEKCTFSPVDRLFTRIGANDNIISGESTFFIEVIEASSILQHATKDSLVLIDELGRGTSTYDGTAVACAVVNELISHFDCRTLFSTHYHSLVGDFASYSNVGLGHMACMVEDDDTHPALENITFLYKFMDGICPKSYGFHSAHLAGISAELIQKAIKKSKAMEKRYQFHKMIWELLSSEPSNIFTKLEETQSLLNEYSDCS